MGPGVPLAMPELALECDAELLARAVAPPFVTLSPAAGRDEMPTGVRATGAPGAPSLPPGSDDG